MSMGVSEHTKANILEVKWSWRSGRFYTPATQVCVKSQFFHKREAERLAIASPQQSSLTGISHGFSLFITLTVKGLGN